MRCAWLEQVTPPTHDKQRAGSLVRSGEYRTYYEQHYGLKLG